jgi:PqqD family protein of HPr-rel-A system
MGCSSHRLLLDKQRHRIVTFSKAAHSVATQNSDRFLVRQWQDGCVVFDRNTGNTHALDLLTFAMLEAVDRHDKDKDAMITACHSYFPLSSANELESMVQACYERLEKCGLITTQSRH